LPDESLSSWLYRVALGNATDLYLFSLNNWPHLAPSMWHRDVDRLSLPEVIESLAKGTGTDLRRARETGLSSFEDIIFEKIDPTSKVPFLLRVGVRAQSRNRSGQQFCPICLSRGEVYFRRRWRLAFATSCLSHGVTLHNHCPRCGVAVAFHRTKDAHKCHSCKAKLTDAPLVDAPRSLVEFEYYLDDTIVEGQNHLGAYGLTRSTFIFRALRQILRILSSGWRGAALREQAVSHMGIYRRQRAQAITGSLEFEMRKVSDRQYLLGLADWLLQDWPERFAHCCAEVGMWHSWAMKDGGQLPWCYVQPVRDYLFGPAYSTSVATRAKSRQPSLFPIDRTKGHGNPCSTKNVRRYELRTRQLELPLDEIGTQADVLNLQREIRKRTVRRRPAS
jgi:hypothetical protein